MTRLDEESQRKVLDLNKQVLDHDVTGVFKQTKTSKSPSQGRRHNRTRDASGGRRSSLIPAKPIKIQIETKANIRRMR